MSRRRQHNACKMQEFHAHTGTINCVHIGRKTSSVYATGADDQVVKIWKLGKTTPVMALEGMTTQIDSVLFDMKEVLVAAGSRGGTIKIWDLEAKKLVRTMPGHRNAVTCLDAHPYGDFFSSGSADSNVKVFDIRKKGCVQTYRGHSGTVTCVKHSPDGRWIVSGDTAGLVKVWDVTTGRLLHELRPARGATGAVVGLDFHPQEYTLAVGAADATTTFWEMENIVAMGATPRESAALRCISFSKDGRALLAATSDALRSWAFDPEVQLYDAMEVGWGGGGAAGGSGASAAAAGGQQVLADMAEGDVPGQELIGVTRCRNVIGVFICELASLRPFDVPMDESADHGATDHNSSLMATLERVPYAENRAPAPADLIVRGGGANGSSSVEENIAAAASPTDAASAAPQTRQQPNAGFFDAHAGGVQVAVPSRPNPYAAGGAAAQPNARAASAQAAQAQPFVPSQPASSSASNGAASAAPSVSSSVSIDARQLPPSKFAAPAASSAADPPSSAAASSATSAAAAAAAAEAALAAARRRIEAEHPTVLSILQERAARLRELSALWQSSGGSLGGAKRCVESLLARPDNGVTYDFLSFVEPVLSSGGASHALTLDVARDLLPLLIKLLSTKFLNYIELALRFTRMLLLQFTQVIQSSRSAASGVGVDLVRDERVQRAQDCFAHFKTIYEQHIASVAKKNNAVGELAKDTRAHLERLLFAKP